MLTLKLEELRRQVANGWPSDSEELLRVQHAVDLESGHVEAMASAYRAREAA